MFGQCKIGCSAFDCPRALWSHLLLRIITINSAASVKELVPRVTVSSLQNFKGGTLTRSARIARRQPRSTLLKNGCNRLEMIFPECRNTIWVCLPPFFNFFRGLCAKILKTLVSLRFSSDRIARLAAPFMTTGKKIKGKPSFSRILQKEREKVEKMEGGKLKSCSYTQETSFPGDCNRFWGGLTGAGNQ